MKWFSRKFILSVITIVGMFFGPANIEVVNKVMAGVAAVAYVVVEGIADVKKVGNGKDGDGNLRLSSLDGYPAPTVSTEE